MQDGFGRRYDEPSIYELKSRMFCRMCQRVVLLARSSLLLNLAVCDISYIGLGLNDASMHPGRASMPEIS